MPTHPVVHFVCQGYTRLEKVASLTALGETVKTASKIFVRLVVRANAPLHDTIRDASLYQEVPCEETGTRFAFWRVTAFTDLQTLPASFIKAINPAHMLLVNVNLTSPDDSQIRHSYMIFFREVSVEFLFWLIL